MHSKIISLSTRLTLTVCIFNKTFDHISVSTRLTLLDPSNFYNGLHIQTTIFIHERIQTRRR